MPSVTKQLFRPGWHRQGLTLGTCAEIPRGSRLPAKPLPGFTRTGFGLIPPWFGFGLQKSPWAAGPCVHLRTSELGMY